MRFSEKYFCRVDADGLVRAGVSPVGFGVTPKQVSRKLRDSETPSPTRETRALPRHLLTAPN
jgi:hypothetical protein